MKTIVQTLLSILCLVGIVGASQSTVTLAANKDSFVYFSDYGCSPSNCNRANQNFGNLSVIHIASYHIDTRGVIGFNMSGVNTWNGKSSSIVSVVLYLPPLTYDSIAYVTSQCTIRINPLENSWGEYNITANNLPAVNNYFSYSVDNSVTAAPGSVWVDITNYVKGKVNSVQNQFSFILTASTNCAIPSREQAPNSIYVKIILDDSSVCPPRWDVCSGQCYDTVMYECVSAYNSYALCPKTYGYCDGGCYDKNTHVCLSNKICPKNSGLCNGSCYDMNSYECFSGMLCSKPQQRCSDACYDTSIYTCNNGVLQHK